MNLGAKWSHTFKFYYDKLINRKTIEAKKQQVYVAKTKQHKTETTDPHNTQRKFIQVEEHSLKFYVHKR